MGASNEAVQNERQPHESDHHEQDTQIDPSPYECRSVPVSEPYHIPDNANNTSNSIQTFPESSFFREKRASTLPSPANIRAINEELNGIKGKKFNRPYPVRFPSLGLFVHIPILLGRSPRVQRHWLRRQANPTIVEAQTQIMLCEKLQDHLPVLEVFGCAENGDQVFIYMALVEGETLMDRWSGLNGDEKQAICEELRDMVKMFRALEQDTADPYIGKFTGKKLNDSKINAFSLYRWPRQTSIERHLP